MGLVTEKKWVFADDHAAVYAGAMMQKFSKARKH
jgi:hypothetical protein